MLTRQEKKELETTKGRYRSLFAGPNGHWVLGNMLDCIFRFNMPATEQETAIRQTAGKELLCLMDYWFGAGQTTSPEHFISKLARFTGEEVKGRSKEKNESKH